MLLQCFVKKLPIEVCLPYQLFFQYGRMLILADLDQRSAKFRKASNSSEWSVYQNSDAVG